MFPSGHKDSAGEAGTNERPRPGKDLWPPGASAARGRLREPTKRRRLTQPGGTPPEPGPRVPTRQKDERVELSAPATAACCFRGFAKPL